MSQSFFLHAGVFLLPLSALLAKPTVDFTRDVRPLLSEYCFHCHGPDKSTREAKLRLDTEEGAHRDLGGYAALVAGKPAESELVLRINSSDNEEIMPPPRTGKVLSPEQRKIIEAWIAQGGEYQEHWSFRPIARPDLPAKRSSAHTVDRFLEDSLTREKLSLSPEADKIYGNVQMIAGTPKEGTIEMLAEFERALNAAARRLAGEGESVVRMSLTKVGSEVGRPGLSAANGAHVGGLIVELTPSDERSVRTKALMAAWREELRPLPGLDTYTILAAQGGPPGRDVDIRLSGDNVDALKAAAVDTKALLKRYPGVSSVGDDLPYGKLETIIELTPDGKAMGFTTQSVGRQVRGAFEGNIAKRFPRGDEEITVRVQYPRNAIGIGTLGRLYLRGEGGAEVALSEVVSTRETRGFSRIRREDGNRQVAVTAELDKGVTSTGEIIEALEQDGIRDIVAKYDLRLDYAGKAEEQATTIGDMKIGAMIGFAGIYIILAWVFASYVRPIVVMSIMPLGFVGAAFGHYLLEFELTILSLIALIGLSGIVVNDSIILVSTIDERLKQGGDRVVAIVDGACDRLRAVILTSATTIGGLLPLMFESSLQAQFLIPMALTMIFGLLFTTLLVLFVVPALIAVQYDAARLKAGAVSMLTGKKNAAI